MVPFVLQTEMFYGVGQLPVDLTCWTIFINNGMRTKKTISP